MKIRDLALITGLSLNMGCAGVEKLIEPKIIEAYSRGMDGKIEYFVGQNGEVKCYIVGPQSQKPGCLDIPDIGHTNTEVHISQKELAKLNKELTKIYAKKIKNYNGSPIKRAMLWNGTEKEAVPKEPVVMDNAKQAEVNGKYIRLLSR